MNKRAHFLASAAFALAVPELARAQCVGQTHQVLLNQRSVCTDTAQDLLELLRRYVPPGRLALAASADEQPLIVVDGAQLYGGTQRLSGIRVDNVESVTVLRPNDARSAYGPKADRGAILVTTKQGRKPLHPA